VLAETKDTRKFTRPTKANKLSWSADVEVYVFWWLFCADGRR